MNLAAPSLSGLVAAAKRFPLPMLVALAFAGLILSLVHTWIKDEDWLQVVAFGLVAGFFLLLALSLAREAAGWSWRTFLLLAGGGAALLVSWIWLEGDRVGTPHFLLGTALLGLCVISPRIRPVGNDALWQFNQKTFSGHVIAGMASGVFAIGILAILYALSELFDFKHGDKFIADSMTLVFALFLPLYTLSFLPRLPLPEGEPPRYPAPLAFVLSWVALPVLLVYGAIILVYAAEVIWLGRPPVASVAWMVMGFAAPAILLHFMLYPMRAEGTALVRLFHRRFFWFLAPLLGLLFWAVGLRLADYGVTEMRYLAVLGGGWASGVALWTLLRRQDFQLWHVPAALVLLLALASSGPWGAERLAFASQSQRLERALIELGVLGQDGVFRPVAAQPDREARANLSSLLDFFRNRRDRRQAAVLEPFQKQMEGYDGPEKLMKQWGMSYINQWDRRARSEARAEGGNIYFRAENYDLNAAPLAVRGYDFVLPVSLYDYGTDSARRRSHKDWSEVGVDLLLRDNQLVLLRGEAELASVALLDSLPQPLDSQPTNLSGLRPEKEILWVGGHARLLVQSMTLKREESGGWQVQNLFGQLLYAGP